jgi:hypothetical protein
MRKLAVLFIALSCRSVFGWGNEGHRLVIRIAEGMLSAEARAQVQATLAPGESLADFATWADEVRKVRKETEPWHFVDIPISSMGLDRQRDCPQNNCVIAKIADLRKAWRDPVVSPADRREALLFLIHFVGDMHQPLHCADNNDHGGNDLLVRFLGEQTKLHSLWDSGLLAHMPAEDQLFATLSQAITPERKAEWSSGTVEQWCNESFRIAQRTVYGLLPPAGNTGQVAAGQSYQSMAEPVVELQLEKAGVRLAAVLNESVR